MRRRDHLDAVQYFWINAAMRRAPVELLSDGRQGTLVHYRTKADTCKVLIGKRFYVRPRSDVVVLDPEHQEKGTPNGNREG